MAHPAGVLVMIEQVSQSLILTLRSQSLSVHAGEVSFPGGSMQADDSDILETALRETEEEIGLTRDRIEIVQPMAKVATLTGFEIYPYLARIDSCSGYRLQAEEVETLIRLPLDTLKDPSGFYYQRRSFARATIKTLAFQHHDYIIWGATAKIMRQLVDLNLGEG